MKLPECPFEYSRCIFTVSTILMTRPYVNNSPRANRPVFLALRYVGSGRSNEAKSFHTRSNRAKRLAALPFALSSFPKQPSSMPSDVPSTQPSGKPSTEVRTFVSDVMMHNGVQYIDDSPPFNRPPSQYNSLLRLHLASHRVNQAANQVLSLPHR